MANQKPPQDKPNEHDFDWRPRPKDGDNRHDPYYAPRPPPDPPLPNPDKERSS